ncbi:MAG: PEP-CTERM sorting domain-containing protein [Pirellulales bacterium]
MVKISIIPRAISGDGRAIVGNLGIDKPALWSESIGAVDLQPFLSGLGLDLTGWRLTEVTAISGDGTTLAGRGTAADASMSGAWIATIPEPSTWVLGGITLALAAVALYRHAAASRSD